MLKNNTTYFALKGDLWSVFYSFRRKLFLNNRITLHIAQFAQFVVDINSQTIFYHFDSFDLLSNLKICFNYNYFFVLP